MANVTEAYEDGRPVSITHPEAEAANAHLSWTDGDRAATDMNLDPVSDMSDTTESFSTFTGQPDGSFAVTVTLRRGNDVATQTEVGSGDKARDIRTAHVNAVERAEQALKVLREHQG